MKKCSDCSIYINENNLENRNKSKFQIHNHKKKKTINVRLCDFCKWN